MSIIIVNIINLIAWIIVVLVIVKVLLSYFLSLYHPIRRTIDRFIEPLLNPIRKYMPSTGMFDFSPLILIIIVQIIASLLSAIILKIF